jgi:hypothetical protein
VLDVPLLSCHFCMKRGTFIEFESICLLLHVDLLKRHVCVVEIIQWYLALECVRLRVSTLLEYLMPLF